MSEIGCGFQRAEDGHAPEWFCVVHQCWSYTPTLCPLKRAEAAIKRVRVLIDTADRFTPPLTLTTAELRRALDGPDE